MKYSYKLITLQARAPKIDLFIESPDVQSGCAVYKGFPRISHGVGRVVQPESVFLESCASQAVLELAVQLLVNLNI